MIKLTCTTAVFNAIKAGNRDKLIRCVESVAKIKAPHEHLIFDGASTDGTVELLRELEAKTPGLKVVSERDTGIYNALNKGVRDAQGRWFSVLGCDDYYSHPETVNRLIDDEPEETDIIVSRIEDGCGFFKCKRDLNVILCGVPCAHMGMLMRTDLVRKFGGFDERYRIAADMNLFHDFLCYPCKAHFLYEPIAYYSPGGETSVDPKLSFRELADVIRRHVGFSKDEMEFFISNGYYHLMPLFRCLKSPVELYRMGARHMIRLYVHHYLRIVFYPLVGITRPLRRKMGF